MGTAAAVVVVVVAVAAVADDPEFVRLAVRRVSACIRENLNRSSRERRSDCMLDTSYFFKEIGGKTIGKNDEVVF